MDEKRIEAAAKELVNALDRCADVINGAFQFAAIHVADYTDAVKLIYGKELDALKRALAGEGQQASPSCGDWRQGVSDTNPKVQEGAIAIPEDLRGEYKLACAALRRDPFSVGTEAEVIKTLIERIAALTQRAEIAESRVKALDWQRITPENLPKVGRDEVYSFTQGVRTVDTTMTHSLSNDPRVWMQYGHWSHRRPISAPAPDSAPVGGKEAER